MRTKIKSMIAGAAALVAAVLHAEPSNESVIVRLTGSSAFRSATHNAIVQLYDSPPVAGYTGGVLSSSSRSFFYGTIGGTKTIITTSWSGSVVGVKNVAGAIPVSFLPDTLADSGKTALAVTGATSATGGTSFSSFTTFESNNQLPDIAMSDVFQTTTPFKTPVLTSLRVGVLGFAWLVNRSLKFPIVTKSSVTTTNASPVISMADVTGILVGMSVKGTDVPQSDVKVLSVDTGANTVTLSHNATATSTSAVLTFSMAPPFTNINTQQAQALWSSGTASLAQFTGVAADANKLVYATGRNADSGTRLTAFAESGIGVDSTVTQYKPTVFNGEITDLSPYPEQTVNGITYTQSNGGEASGGTLVGYFGNVSTLGLIVSYVSSGEVLTAVNAGAVQLTYNGVAYSIDAIKEGHYTFWCYEHLMYPSTLVAAKKSVADALATKIETVTAPIKLMDMRCSRTTDGSTVYHD